MFLEVGVVAAFAIAFAAYQLFGRMFGQVLYIRIEVDRITLRNVSKASEATLSAQHEAMSFSHPRALIGNFSHAEQLLRKLSKQMGGFTAPQAVIHPLERIEGGLTQIEDRCLRELALGGANARKAVVHVGPQLGDAEVVARLKKA